MTEIIGQLHGINAPSGTVIGYHARYLRFISVDSNGFYSKMRFVNIRFSTQQEINLIGTDWPRSVIEHKGIRRRMSPYGMVRQVDKIHYPKGILNGLHSGQEIRISKDGTV
jgi:hypothetical protein